MQVIETALDRFINNNEIKQYTLINDRETEINIYNYGAIVQSFIVKLPDGTKRDIVLGFNHIDGYLSDNYLDNYTYMGAIVGRYANRIKGASYFRNGSIIRLSDNKDGNTLHGGFEGFDKKIFNYKSSNNVGDVSVTLEYISADGEEGFPGELKFTVTYSLSNDDSLTVKCTASTTKDTPLSVTQHSYFNLSGKPVHIGSHKLFINSNSYLQQDEEYCTTGQLLPVKNTTHDFTALRNIDYKWDSAEGYDQTFVLNPHSVETPVAELVSPDGKINMLVYTNQPILHLYTSKYVNNITGKDNDDYKPFSAVCLETSGYPNAVNRVEFPNTILKAGSDYFAETTFRVNVL